MDFVYQFSNEPNLFDDYVKKLERIRNLLKEIRELQNKVDKNADKWWHKNLPTKDKNI